MTDPLKTIESRVLWLSHWMIHNANHLRPKADAIKTGGHQASSASMVSIMTALYFSALRPQDRVAVKPHASPVFHAIQYLMGNQTLEKMREFPRARRRAVLSVAHQGHRRRGLLDRLGWASGSRSPPSPRSCRTTSRPSPGPATGRWGG